MGNSSSHNHEPLERGFTRGKFGDVKNGKSASFRFSKKSPKKMDRLRRSFRDSFRRRKDRIPESSKPHQWQADEEAVRSATCSFAVKYLGCVEVFESRGMQVCEEALKVLRNSRRRPIRGLLHVSGDGLRVVDDDTKGLIVDQTIEKVSFCAPDRNHERGFSYICRDGTTRRWMCHGFLACKDSGERLSHAVGCAFAVCLERKQRRDKECGVTMTFDMKNSTFTRSGSFRQQTLTERIANNERGIDTGATTPTSAAVVAQQKPFNPFAIERPHATPSMLERQGSFRAFSTIGSQSPFKRQMSLRINDLPSNAERQKAFYTSVASSMNTAALNLATPQQRNVSPIPEVSPHKAAIKTSSISTDCNDPILKIATIAPSEIDTVSQLCKELSHGLSLLTTQTSNSIDDMNFNNMMSVNQNIAAEKQQQQQQKQIISSTTTTTATTFSTSNGYCSTTTETTATSIISGIGAPATSSITSAAISITSPPTAQISPRVAAVIPIVTSSQQTSATTTSQTILSRVSPQRTTGTVPVEIVAPLPKADQWLGQIVKNTSPAALKRNPILSSTGRTKSLSAAQTDPFDAEWVSSVTKPISPEVHSTNPFISPPKPPAQSFQVQL